MDLALTGRIHGTYLNEGIWEIWQDMMDMNGYQGYDGIRRIWKDMTGYDRILNLRIRLLARTSRPSDRRHRWFPSQLQAVPLPLEAPYPLHSCHLDQQYLWHPWQLLPCSCKDSNYRNLCALHNSRTFQKLCHTRCRQRFWLSQAQMPCPWPGSALQWSRSSQGHKYAPALRRGVRLSGQRGVT